jgi:preprotein translocase subunit SecY
MWEKFRVIFTIPELRQKILLTMLFLAIYRVGFQIPLPIVDVEFMKSSAQTQSSGLGSFFNQAAIFSASNLTMGTIFGLGIMPYISASIIFQLLGSVWGPLEQLQKEGESGRKKINEYTRYATVVICIGQSWGYLAYIIHGTGSRSFVAADFLVNGHLPFFWQFLSVMVMTTGTVFLMWLGEQIDEFGIGNGISLLIMAGILARMPNAFIEMIGNSSLELGGSVGKFGPEKWIVMGVLFIAVVAGVVYMDQGQRRIPTQSAKHVRGRRVFGGTRQYLPLKVNHSGVMPIIFASSLLLFPNVLFRSLAASYGGIWDNLNDAFTRGTSYIYNVAYIVLIYFFCYFWTAIMFNPKDVADNLKDFGTFIPGYRPGKRTEDYLEKVMVRITYVGAAFLSVVAIVPTLVNGALDIPFTISQFYGGTTLLIAVSVAFDLVQKIDSHLVMRNYKGLLE